MSIWIDVFAIVILIASVYRGYKKGIVGVAFKLVAFIVSILVALIFYRPATDYIINNTEIDEKIEAVITSKDKENNSEGQQNEKDEQDYSKELVEKSKEAIAKNAAKPIAENIIGIGVIIALFIGSRIILILVKMILDLFTNIPIIKQLNQMAGLAYGLVIGLGIIYLISLVLNYFHR